MAASSGVGIYGIVANGQRPNYSGGGEQEVSLTTQGAQLIANAVPDYADLVSKGNSFVVIAGTAVAPVAAIPTTAAHFTWWNGEQPGGKSLVVDYVGTIITTSPAAVITLSLLCHQGTNQTFTQPTISNPATAKGLNGSGYRGVGYGGGNGTIVQSSSWHPAPINTPALISSASTAQIGMVVGGDVRGRYVMPPGTAFSMASFCSAAGSATCQIFMIAHEVQIVNN